MNVRTSEVSSFPQGQFRSAGADRLAKFLAGLAGLCTFLPQTPANPVGPSVAQGSASFSSQGSHLTIQTSGRAFINWQSFNIWPGETTSFVQPSSSSLVWNQIHDQNPSQILGNLNANGYVVLQNASGFYIGGHASISAHGLLMTTAPIPLPDLSSGGPWDFNTPPPTASIINYGQINLSRGGSAFLLAHAVQNSGTINAPEGSIGLYAGKQVLISDRPDGRGLSAQVTLPDGSVDNSGKLIADAGSIALHAQVVNQGGLVQANSVREVNGTIELVAGDTVNLGPDSVIQAAGGTQGTSPGGSVLIKSGNRFADQAGSVINVAGGASGGNGGQVEISASQMSAIDSQISGRAAPGFTSAGLFIDPANILLSNQGDDAPGSGTVNPGDPPSAGSPDTLTLNVNSLNSLISQNALSQISLQASRNIEVNTSWSLPASQDPKAALTLTAGNNITIDDGAEINAGKNWSVNLFAGPASLASRPASGTDSIYLNGRAFLQAQNGDLSLWAANDVKIATGSTIAVGNNGIRTVDGGSISVTAQFGDVNTGSNPQGFRYTSLPPFYSVSQNLGGISTAAGGNVSITAGGDITSFLPFGSGPTATGDGGSGAFGPEPGDVTISAGGDVFGHYAVANGTGSITAGQDVGGAVASQNVALSLVKGSWTVNAPKGNIYLQEVRNPNGVFDNAGRPGSPGYHWFDYDPHAAVELNAGDGVYLTCLNLPRGNDAVPAIFPPTLDINAGSGGIVLADPVTLFPSVYGELNLITTSGGNFMGNPNNPALTPTPELLMSDSGHTHWTGSGDFGDTDHAAIPPGLNNPNPVVVNIAGDMNNLILSTAKATTVKVGGDMIGCSFSGQNLRASDVTSLDVAGQIFNRSPYSFIILPQDIPGLPTADSPPNATLTWDSLLTAALDPAKLATLQVPPSLDPSKWATYAATYAALLPGNPGFVYNPTTRRLGFDGQMSEAVRSGLEQPLTVLRFGPDGLPILDATGHFVTDKVTWVTATQIEQLYQASLGAPSTSNPSQLGYRIGGPGQFDVQADSLSLGNSYGILSCGTGDPAGNRYADLAGFTPAGATVNVDVNGNLDMLTSTIAALGGGNVNVNSAHGAIDLGSQELFNSSRSVALGVYTSGRGDVTVSALGDINIDGSRIAAYNGGNISVTSLEGNVNAGSGGTSFVSVYSYFVDPVTGQPGAYQELVFGSGIVANTLVKPGEVPGSATRPGNISVQTAQGDILASLGGIVQEALNGDVSAGPTITLIAGTPASANSPGHKGNIDLGDSGVIGGTVDAQANGNITGLVISRQNATINAAQSFSGTVLSGGTASLAAGGTISGTVIGVGGVNASGGQGVSASLLGQNVSVGGAAAQSTLGTTAAATSTSQAAAAQTSSDARDQLASDNSDDDDAKKKKKTLPVLARKTGRVTVILPAAN